MYSSSMTVTALCSGNDACPLYLKFEVHRFQKKDQSSFIAAKLDIEAISLEVSRE